MLALGVNSHTIQQRLLREATISLKESINLASATEAAEADHIKIHGASNKIHSVDARTLRTKVEPRSTETQGTSHNRIRLSKDICFRCGRSAGMMTQPSGLLSTASARNAAKLVISHAFANPPSKKPISIRSATDQVSSVK